jgi:microcystin-dependent protein
MAGGLGTPWVGEIRMVAFNFNPYEWMLCNGQLLPISQYSVLFSLIGTTYGGDGQTTFAVPDLRGRVPVGAGQGQGLSSYAIGQSAGVEEVTLTVNELPSHQHLYVPAAGSGEATTDHPDDAYPAVGGYYAATTNSGAPMPSPTIANAGGSQPHDNIQPYLGINFIISLYGIYPSQS